MAQGINSNSIEVAVAGSFLCDEGAWRVPKPLDLFGLEAIATHHMQEEADTLAWLEYSRALEKEQQNAERS